MAPRKLDHLEGAMMQTFLPYEKFSDALLCLDPKRLGKQRVEAMQILQALEPGSTSRWRNHPAVRMWKDYQPALRAYHDMAILIWIKRGYNNTMKLRVNPEEEIIKPHWLNDEFCARHRSNLLRKWPEFYQQYGWSEPDDLPYIWPV